MQYATKSLVYLQKSAGVPLLIDIVMYNSGRMYYRERLAKGLSIASGQIEGFDWARLKQTGIICFDDSLSQPNNCPLFGFT